jgi:diphthamide synthase (EF-2-diphthine--ammonia ligase)
MIEGGLRARLCCVDTTQLDARFAGRTFDEALLRELPDGVDPCGERGEFHTCVFAGPMFAAPLALASGDTVLRDGRFAYTDFTLRS